MTVVAVTHPATFIGPASLKAGHLTAAAVGDFYFEDDTGVYYRKSVLGAWIAVVGIPLGAV